MLIALSVAIVLLAQAAPSVGSTQPTAATSAPSKNLTAAGKSDKGNKDPNELICHSELPMGSRIPVKTCATRRELEERRSADQMDVRQMTILRPDKGN